MMDKALLNGLAFRRDIEFDTLQSPPAISDSYSEFMHGAYKLLTGGRAFHREIGANPVPSSATDLREAINETIDSSVFERRRSNNAYRPQNLIQWAERHKVDAGTLTSTVWADDPSKGI